MISRHALYRDKESMRLRSMRHRTDEFDVHLTFQLWKELGMRRKLSQRFASITDIEAAVINLADVYLKSMLSSENTNTLRSNPVGFTDQCKKELTYELEKFGVELRTFSVAPVGVDKTLFKPRNAQYCFDDFMFHLTYQVKEDEAIANFSSTSDLERAVTDMVSTYIMGMVHGENTNILLSDPDTFTQTCKESLSLDLDNMGINLLALQVAATKPARSKVSS